MSPAARSWSDPNPAAPELGELGQSFAPSRRGRAVPRPRAAGRGVGFWGARRAHPYRCSDSRMARQAVEPAAAAPRRQAADVLDRTPARPLPRLLGRAPPVAIVIAYCSSLAKPERRAWLRRCWMP